MTTKISWDNIEKLFRTHGDDEGEDLYDKLCKQSSPADFYFAVSNSLSFDPEENDAFTFIALVPKVYFNKEGCMWDQSMNLDHILPEDFGEEMESIWGTSRNIEDVRKDMLARGFEENKDFIKAAQEY